MRNILLTIVLLLFGCVNHKSDDYIGADFLGAKYKLNPLGEGVAPDTDPLIRYDAFDCVTFVETSLANGDIKTLNKIRYQDGVPSFTKRNHFIETDWLENNAWLVKNVSSKYAPTAIHNVKIDKKRWFKTLHNIDTNFAPRTINLEYIPSTYASNIVVSEPVIIFFIMNNKKIRNKIGTELAVRHMGFLLPNKMLRHASSKSGKVLDVNFSEYMQQMMDNKNNLGIMLLEIKK